MKPAAPLRGNFSAFALTTGRGLSLNRGLEIYRAEGVQALLQFLREEQPLGQTQEPAAQSLPPHKKQPNLFGGGSGDSFETAVVVDAKNPLVGVEAEYAYIANQCGEPHKINPIQRGSLWLFFRLFLSVLSLAQSRSY